MSKGFSVRKGFSMIEMLFVMTVMGMLASIALPNYAENLKAKMYVALETDLNNCLSLTNKIVSDGYVVPIIDFTSTPANKTLSSGGYKYVLSYSNVHFTQVQTYNTTLGNYSGIGIIISNSQFPECMVFNDQSDSAPNKSSSCTPTDLSWDFQS